jgi:tetratricopeptide (TPR) repeat protein
MRSSLGRILTCAAIISCGASDAFAQFEQSAEGVAILRRAVEAQARKDYDTAEAELTRIIERDPASPFAFSTRAAVRFLQGKLNAAFTDYDKAATLDPELSIPVVGRAMICCQIGQYELALEDATQALKLQPFDNTAYLLRGKSLLELGRYSEALNDFAKFLQASPDSAQGHTGLAAAYVAVGEHRKAVDSADAAFRIKPDDPATFTVRGTAYSFLKEFDKAIADFDQSIRLRPDNPKPYIARAVCFASKRDFARMLNDCNEALRLKPGNSYCLAIRAIAYELLGEFDKAAADLDRAVQTENSARLLTSRADFRVRRGDYAHAIDDYRQSLQPSVILPANEQARARRDLAWLQAACPDDRIRNGRQAVEDATAACELTQWQDPASIESLAAAHAEAGDFAAAVHWQTKAVELQPANAQALGRLELFRAGKPYRQEPGDLRASPDKITADLLKLKP